MASGFRSAGQSAITIENIQSVLFLLLFKVSLLLMPLLITITVVALLANVIQVGVLFSPAAIQPELSKIDPLKGMQRLLSLRSFAELIKSIMKMTIVGVIAYLVIKDEVSNVLPLAEQSIWGL